MLRIRFTRPQTESSFLVSRLISWSWSAMIRSFTAISWSFNASSCLRASISLSAKFNAFSALSRASSALFSRCSQTSSLADDLGPLLTPLGASAVARESLAETLCAVAAECRAVAINRIMKIIDSLFCIVRRIVHHLLLVRDQISDNRVDSLLLIDIRLDLLLFFRRTAAAA